MAVTTTLRTSPAAGARPRLPGPDVVRAVALIGVVVMNYHGDLILQGGPPDDEDRWRELMTAAQGGDSAAYATLLDEISGVIEAYLRIFDVQLL